MSFVDKMSEFVETKIAPPLVKVSEHKYMDAIQRAFIAMTPVFIIGSLFLLVVALPIPAWKLLIKPFAPKIIAAVNTTYGLISIATVCGVSYFLGGHYYKTDKKVMPFSAMIIAFFTFMMFFTPESNKEVGMYIAIDDLGAQGLFAAIVTAIVSVEIYAFLIRKRITITMPDGVPPMVAGAFIALIPGAASILVGWLIGTVLEVDTVKIFTAIFSPLVSASDSLAGATVTFLLDRMLWFVGIHGSNVVGAVAGPIWVKMVTANAAAVSAGQPLPYILTSEFINYYPRVSFLPLIILMLLSKSSRYKTLGKLAFPASLFNIGEPIVYGLPLVLNPLCLIPWVFGYAFLLVLDYTIVMLGLAPVPYISVPWTTPGPIMAYLGTGCDWRAMVLSLANYVIMFFIWWPFFKALEKREMKLESEGGDVV